MSEKPEWVHFPADEIEVENWVWYISATKKAPLEWICVWFQGQNSIWKYSHCIRDRAEQEPLVTRAEFSAATNKNDALDMALLQYQGFVA